MIDGHNKNICKYCGNRVRDFVLDKFTICPKCVDETVSELYDSANVQEKKFTKYSK